MEKIVEWNGMELAIRDFEKSHANGGRLGKLWVEDRKSGRIFLVKSSSFMHYEPLSEKMAYIVGKNLGIDVLEYDIIPIKEFSGFISNPNPLCPYVSICEKIDRKGYYITSVAEIKRARNALLGEGEQTITNKEIMYEVLPRTYIDTMLLFDAIIGNIDRHYGNVHILRSTDGEMIGAPILDNGASLCANSIMCLASLANYKVGERFNQAYTIGKTHDEQIITIESLTNVRFNIATKTIDILNEIEPILELMPKQRAKVIKKYLVYRLHKYLGLIKYSDAVEYTRQQRKRTKTLKEKEESGQ